MSRRVGDLVKPHKRTANRLMPDVDSLRFTPEACRAARALLGWSIRDLAAAAGLSPDAIVNLERPQQTARGATYAKVCQAFAAEGVELIVGPTRRGAVLDLAHKPGGDHGGA